MDRKFSNKFVIFLIVVALIGMGAGGVYLVETKNLLKTIDPENSRFDPLRFDPTDYHGNIDLIIKAAKKAMPQGTDIQTVRLIMKNNSSCFNNKREPHLPGFVFFVCAHSIKYPKGVNFIFWFDQNNRLIDYFGSGHRGIYTNRFPDDIQREIQK